MGHTVRTTFSAAIALAALAVVRACPGGVSAQGLTGRFHPEKETYLVGEPIFIVYEVRNEGEKPVPWGTGPFYGPCSGGVTFEVHGVELRPEWQPSCRAIAGSCLGSIFELEPGKESTERFLLNERYDFREPGDYEVTAATLAKVKPDGSGGIEFKSSFRITLVPGDLQELQAAFQPYVQRLKEGYNLLEPEPDYALREEEAVVAVTTLAPPFLGNLLEELTRDSDAWKASMAIGALLRLNTPGAGKALTQLAEQSRFGTKGIEQETIERIGEAGDRAYLPVLVSLAKDAYRYNRYSAARAVGELGRAEAVPFLVSLLQDPDPLVRQGAVQGLAGTASREAVPAVLSMFTDPDAEVRVSAANSFVSLTHASEDLESADASGAAQEKTRAVLWWRLNGERSPIYAPGECSETQPSH
jgi:HEAT repeats